MATKGTVLGVIANMVTLTVDAPVAQNEICYISTGGDRLMAEVIKVVGKNVYVQVFESTRGLKVGAEAEFTGHMLEVTLTDWHCFRIIMVRDCRIVLEINGGSIF